MIQVKNLPAPDDRRPVSRALLSVFDKTGIVEFARGLHALGIELVSTGGTAAALEADGLPVVPVSGQTGFPEILGGRVKTLHPALHGGLLARRNDPEDMRELAAHGIEPIDLVVVNLYPFARATSRPDCGDAEAAENVDIGGPAMIRAAAKNFFFVGVVTDPTDYGPILSELRAGSGTLGLETRRRLARDAFARTSAYDAGIAGYFDRSGAAEESGAAEGSGAAEESGAAEGSGASLLLDERPAQALRYGENPHQRAFLYGRPERFYEQLHGRELSYNNLLDLSAALLLIDEFAGADPTVAILKHTNPCGVATAVTLEAAYRAAFATDRQSPFGGIVVTNRDLDEPTARAIDEVFTEVVIAPGFADAALDFLMRKKNRRILRMLGSAREDTRSDLRTVIGGILVQSRDPALPSPTDLRSQLQVVTRRAPTESEWRDLDFAWRVVKHTKSNAIVYARDRATLGIGAGQMSRIDASETAVRKGVKSGLDFSGSVVASDAFFPFADGLVEAARAGAGAAIQPGGSVRDEEVIAAADEHDLAMVFTGTRHFRH